MGPARDRASILPAVAVALLLWPAVLAAGPQADLTSPRIAWQLPIESDGALALTQRSTLASPPPSSGDGPSFSLDAESLWLETAYAQVSVANAGSPQAAEVDHSNFTVARVESTASRPERILYVTFEQGAPDRASIPCGTLAAASVSSVDANPNVDVSREAIRVGTADALVASPCAESTFEVHGDFTMVLWEWDFRVSGADGSADLETGYLRQDLLPQPADARPALGSAREAYLHARNATLRLDSTSETPTSLFLSRLTLLGTPQLTLYSPEGHFAMPEGPVEVAASSLQLSGSLQGLVDRTPDGQLRAIVQSGLEEARMDGRSYQVAGTAVDPQPRGGLPWPWLAAPLLLLLAGGCALAVLYVRGRRILEGGGARATVAAGHVLSADFCIERQQLRRALWHTTMALRWAPATAEALEVRIDALRLLGRDAETLSLRAQLHEVVDGDPELAFDNAVEAAAAASRASQPTLALDWLETAARQRLEALEAVLARAEFKGLADQPRVRALRARAASMGHAYS